MDDDLRALVDALLEACNRMLAANTEDEQGTALLDLAVAASELRRALFER